MTDLAKLKCPDYELQVSRRARHLRIKVTPLGKVVVVVPVGVDPAVVPRFLAEKQHWLRRVLQRVAEQQRSLPAAHSLQPDRIVLAAIREEWRVVYVNTMLRKLMVSDASRRLHLNQTASESDNAASLRHWLQQRARQILPKWLQQVSEELNLPFEQVQVRGQKTRWGSCSSRGTISLNRNLLFLPAMTVRYLFIHELCHTQHMNHSARFWQMVAHWMPDYVQHEKVLRQASRNLPLWVYG
ncbi:MAG: M48 family metallopeptidase [Gammaproteobacteria bacterium]